MTLVAVAFDFFFEVSFFFLPAASDPQFDPDVVGGGDFKCYQSGPEYYRRMGSKLNMKLILYCGRSGGLFIVMFATRQCAA